MNKRVVCMPVLLISVLLSAPSAAGIPATDVDGVVAQRGAAPAPTAAPASVVYGPCFRVPMSWNAADSGPLPEPAQKTT